MDDTNPSPNAGREVSTHSIRRSNGVRSGRCTAFIFLEVLNMPQFIRTAQLVRLASMGLVYSFSAGLMMHILRPENNPVTMSLSQYVLGPYGYMARGIFFMSALSILAITLGLNRELPHSHLSHVGVVLLTCAGVGVLVAGIFPPDVPRGYGPLTPAGTIHREAATLSFATLVTAMLFISSCFACDTRWESVKPKSWVLALINLAMLFIVGVVFALRLPIFGICERILTGSILLWLFLAAGHLKFMTTQDAKALPILRSRSGQKR